MEPFLQRPPRVPDAWRSDGALRRALRFHLGDELFALAEPELAALGELVASERALTLLAKAACEEPVHIPYSAWGERIDDIVVSDAYLELGRIGVEAGVTALPYEDTPYGDAARLVWAGLIALWGPASAMYACPVAMTDAAARTLLEHGGPEVLDVVGRLTARDPARAWTSGQWMTETAGGSDVGRTGTVARLQDGEWRLYGTKWFTSATTSEMALTLARPEGAPPGSRGLALFRVERTLPDGSRNRIIVRRLKDKLGTRTLPTAELELQGALAHPVGDPHDGRGVARIATMLNITRIHNALGSVGSLGRGLALARSYAEVREVFGRPLAQQPAHRATLADLAVDHAAALALTLRCCELTGKAEHGRAHEGELALLRGLTPVTKAATARWAVAGAAEAMEAIGGVGYCEDSLVPMLVRDTHVQPIWEGTTNVLALDLLRAQAKHGSLSAIVEDARTTAQGCAAHPAVAGSASAVLRALKEIEERAAALAGDADAAQTGARSLLMSLALAYACARLCAQAAAEVERGELRSAALAARLAARGLVVAEAPRDLELAFDQPPASQRV